MTMRDLTEDEIARYVQIDEPLDCAGSYKIERLGIALFESIEGDDFTAIEGLPLLTVVSMLRRAGFAVP
jgi:septum formation protein